MRISARRLVDAQQTPRQCGVTTTSINGSRRTRQAFRSNSQQSETMQSGGICRHNPGEGAAGIDADAQARRSKCRLLGIIGIGGSSGTAKSPDLLNKLL